MTTTRIQFDSTEALVAEARSDRPANWAPRSSRRGPLPRFNATRTFDDACRLATEGWPEGRRRMQLAIDAAANSASFASLPDMRLDVGGAYPVPALAAAGSPESMVNPAPMDESRRPVVRILTDQRVSALYGDHELFNWGAALAVVIDALEQNGYRVEYEAGMFMQHDGDIFLLRTMVKRAEDALDVDRVAFAVGNADFFRRICFSIMELHLARHWSSGYGYPVQARQEFGDEDQIILPGPQAFKGGSAQLRTPEAALAAYAPIFGARLADRFATIPANCYVSKGADA